MMTTIATDGITLAADGKITCGDIIENLNAQKVFRLKDGTAIAFAGCLHSGIKFKAWIDAGQPDAVPVLSDNFTAVRINGSATVLQYDTDCHAVELPVPFATGSGGILALGAMLAGATPKEAVKIACQRDVWSGGKVRSVTIESQGDSTNCSAFAHSAK